MSYTAVSTSEVAPAEVKLVGVARHVHTGQPLVVYDHPQGLLACTLNDWANNFSAPLEPEKVPLPQAVMPPTKTFGKREGVPY